MAWHFILIHGYRFSQIHFFSVPGNDLGTFIGPPFSCFVCPQKFICSVHCYEPKGIDPSINRSATVRKWAGASAM
jgi:hypothetical protein